MNVLKIVRNVIETLVNRVVLQKKELVRKENIMSKTIIITTDEMINILKTYLDDSDTLDNLFCRNCRDKNKTCIAGDDDCPFNQTDDKFVHFINTVFANYMIPFS